MAAHLLHEGVGDYLWNDVSSAREGFRAHAFQNGVTATLTLFGLVYFAEMLLNTPGIRAATGAAVPINTIV